MNFLNKTLESGIALLIFLLPWQTVWIIHEAMIGPDGAQGVWQYGTLRIYAIEFLILALALLAVTFLHNHRPRNLSVCAQWILAFLLFAGLSIFWSDDRLVALFAWIRLLEGAILFFLFRSVHLNVRWFLGAWIIAAVVQSILGLWQFGTQEVAANSLLGIAAHDPSTLGTSVVEAGDRRWLRAYGAFPHPNILGVYLSISMVFCATALTRAHEKIQWIVLIGSSQIILLALLFTFSRSAWFALLAAACVGMVAALISFRKRGLSAAIHAGTRTVHPLAIMVVASMMTVFIFISIFPEETATRFGYAQTRLESQSLSERVGILERAASFPLATRITGTGIGNFTNALYYHEQATGTAQPWYAYQPIHNVFLMIVAELGIIGAVLILILLWSVCKRVSVAGYPLLAALLGASLFDHFLWTLPSGIFLVGIVLGILVNHRNGVGGLDSKIVFV
ncbi:O-antigen ligase family protein [Candidatus Uhrbacteria bacterium]|nr:O-antigen ligase family protein [Candidatus Uhrbacteria bacterium]